MEEPFAFRSLSRERRGRYEIELAQLDTPQGPSPYSIVHMKPFSCVAAFVQGQLAMVRQYRYSVQSWQVELPAGGIEKGELPGDAANRELAEETGLVAQELIDLGMLYPSVGSTDEVCHLFAARCTGERVAQQLDQGEQVELVLFSRQEIERMMDVGSLVYPPLYAIWLKLQRRGLLDSFFEDR